MVFNLNGCHISRFLFRHVSPPTLIFFYIPSYPTIFLLFLLHFGGVLLIKTFLLQYGHIKSRLSVTTLLLQPRHVNLTFGFGFTSCLSLILAPCVVCSLYKLCQNRLLQDVCRLDASNHSCRPILL